VAWAAEDTGPFVFDAPDLFAETAFLAEADFFATFAEEAFFAAFRTLAQRAFWAAAILARALALKVRFFVLFGRKLAFVAFFVDDAAAVLRAAFFAAFFDFAQRALWAAAIFSRASALNVRLALALPAKLLLAGRPAFRFRVVLVPANSAFTCCSPDISASIWAKMSCMFTNPPVLRINHWANSNSVPSYRFSSTAAPWEKEGASGCNSQDCWVGLLPLEPLLPPNFSVRLFSVTVRTT